MMKESRESIVAAQLPGVIMGLSLLIGTQAGAADSLPQLDCLIQPQVEVELSSPVQGVVESMHVDKSDIIKKGQPLVQLDASIQQAAVEFARGKSEMIDDILAKKANSEFMQRKKKQFEELYKKKAISSFELDEVSNEARLSRLELEKSRSSRKLSKLELQQAVAALELRTLRSPIDGVVVERYRDPGESVEEQPVLKLAQIDPLRIDIIVPGDLFGEIEVGMVATILPEKPGDARYQARVEIVDRVVDAASGTFDVRLSLPNPDYSLVGGIRCMAQFEPEGSATPQSGAQFSFTD